MGKRGVKLLAAGKPAIPDVPFQRDQDVLNCARDLLIYLRNGDHIPFKYLEHAAIAADKLQHAAFGEAACPKCKGTGRAKRVK